MRPQAPQDDPPSAKNTRGAEISPDAPPRLCREDLERPDAFRKRLREWLMRQQ